MREIRIILVIGIFAFMANIASAQVRPYLTSGGELMFSFAIIDNNTY